MKREGWNIWNMTSKIRGDFENNGHKHIAMVNRIKMLHCVCVYCMCVYVSVFLSTPLSEGRPLLGSSPISQKSSSETLPFAAPHFCFSDSES